MGGTLSTLLRYSIVVAFVTWCVLLTEFFLAIALLVDARYRRFIFAAGVVLHTLIWIIHGLGTFSLTMIGVLSLYFGIPDSGVQQVASGALARLRKPPWKANDSGKVRGLEAISH